MKKTFIVALCAVMMASCNKQAPKVDEKPASQNAPTELKIAFVEVDSIMTQYTFCKEKSKRRKATTSRAHSPRSSRLSRMLP